MKKKIIIFLLLAISTASYSQGLYSEDDNNSFDLFGEPATKEGTALYAKEGYDGEPPAPVGEGILLLVALAGVYLLIGHKTKRTR
jgi:hypothetical protein